MGSPRHAGKTRRGIGSAILACVVIFLAALAPRLHGLDYLLPCVPEPDNAYAVQPRLISGELPEGKSHPYYRKYPHLISHVVLAIPWREDSAARAPGASGDRLEDHLIRASSPTLRARRVVAVLGALCAPATFVLARAFLPLGWSLMAGALVASSLLHLQYSQEARPHAVVATTSLFAVLAALAVVRRPAFASYVLAGVAAAVAIGTLYNGVAVLMPLAAAHLLRAEPRRKIEHLYLAVAILLAAAAFPVWYPFLELRGMVAPGRAEGRWIDIGGHEIELNLDGSGVRTVLATLASYDPILLLLTAAGLLWAFVSVVRGYRSIGTRAMGPQARDLAVVSSYALPCAILLGLYAGTHSRYVVPVLPYFAVLSAAALHRLSRATGARPWPSIALALAALALPVAVVAKLSWLRGEPDTLEQAARFLEEHARKDDSILVSPGVELPLLQDRRALEWNAREVRSPHIYLWTNHLLRAEPIPAGADTYRTLLMPVFGGSFWQDLDSDPRGAVSRLEADYVVCAALIGHDPPPKLTAVRNVMAETGELVARFSAWRAQERSYSLVYYVEPPAICSVLRAKALGPVVEVYRTNP
jgi:hypothetical protein